MKRRESFSPRLRTILLLIGLFCIVFSSNSWGGIKQTPPSDEGTDVIVTGELTVLFIDDFDNRTAKVIYHLKEIGSGKVFNLHFKDEPPGKLRTGAIVTVRGKAKDRDIYLMADTGGTQVEQLVSSAPAVAGDQKTIVIVANFLDTAVACSVADIEYRVFSDPLNKSVDALYREMSFDQLWLTGDVAGPFTINYSTTSACDISAWASAADAAASASGVNLATYNRKIYVLPRTNPCGYIGVGTVGGNPSRAWIFRCDGSDTFAHELGHNLGMNHASTPTDEYGDTSDIMGYGGFGLRHINGPHQDQTGWINPLQMKGVVESGMYSIAPLELNVSQAIAPQVLIVPKPDTGESYYLTYRQAVGFDSSLPSTYLKGVNIHRHKTDSATRTYLLGVLADSGSFTDSINGVTITQVNHTDQYVTVQVQIDQAPACVNNAPAVNISPVGQSANGGSALTYSVVLTNMDSTACAQTTFSLAGTVPVGWIGTVSPSTLTLAPGAIGSALLTVTSPAIESEGDYPVAVEVSDGVLPIHLASRTATYTVLPIPVCIPSAPIISISPVTQSGQSGSTLSYSVSVLNKDSADCAATTFLLNRSLPAGWTGTVSPSTLTLMPGAGASATLSVTSPTTAVAGSYNISVNVSDSSTAAHTAAAGGTYSVAGDTAAPSAPTGLTAKLVRGKVMLSWGASTDNIGIAGYKVWRNNGVIAQTTNTLYTDYSVTAGQNYTYFVTAFDAAGNSSAGSNTATVTISAGGKKK
jgi:hypothetical protein